jgi:hypothetical protein
MKPRSLSLPLFFCVGLLISSILSVHATMRNAVENNGFESGVLNPWIGSYAIVSGSVFHTGSYSCNVGTALMQVGYVEQTFNPQVPVNLVSNWTYWLNATTSEASPWFLVKVYCSYNGTGEDILWERTLNPPATWTFYDETTNLKAMMSGYYIARIKFEKPSAYYSVYVDDVILYGDIPEPTSPEGYDYSPMMSMIVPFMFLFLPALILVPYAGKMGFIVGLTIGTVCLYLGGMLPLWVVFLLGLGEIVLLLKGGTWGSTE